jgi:hypothetical protein
MADKQSNISCLGADLVQPEINLSPATFQSSLRSSLLLAIAAFGPSCAGIPRDHGSEQNAEASLSSNHEKLDRSEPSIHRPESTARLMAMLQDYSQQSLITARARLESRRSEWGQSSLADSNTIALAMLNRAAAADEANLQALMEGFASADRLFAANAQAGLEALTDQVRSSNEALLGAMAVASDAMSEANQALAAKQIAAMRLASSAIKALASLYSGIPSGAGGGDAEPIDPTGTRKMPERSGPPKPHQREGSKTESFGKPIPLTLDLRDNSVSEYDPTQNLIESCLNGGMAGAEGGVQGIGFGCFTGVSGKFAADQLSGKAFERRKLEKDEVAALDAEALRLYTALQERGDALVRKHISKPDWDNPKRVVRSLDDLLSADSEYRKLEEQFTARQALLFSNANVSK